MNDIQIKEKNLLKSLYRFDKLGVFSVDKNFICIEWNIGMNEITGISEKEILHKNLLSVFPDFLHSKHYENIRAAFQKKNGYLEGSSFSPFSRSGKENFTISYIPVLNEGNSAEACLIIANPRDEYNFLKKELEKIQSRYETLTENSGVGIWQISPDGNTEYVNPAMCRILGIGNLKEIKGKSYHTFFSEESLLKMKGEHQHRLNNLSTTYESELIKADGTPRTIIIHGAPLLSKEGKLEGMIGSFIDITDKKISEAALKKSEERFRLMFEKTLTPTGISRNGNLILVNDAYVKLFKYNSPQELVGTSVINLVAVSDREKVLELIRVRNEGRQIPSFSELQGVKKDGTEFPFHLEITSIELPDGHATIIALKDITEQKASQDALRYSEAKFRGIFKSHMIGITFSDKDQKIVEANDKFLSIIQYNQEDLATGKLNWIAVTPPEYFDRDAKAVEEFMQKGFITPYEKEYIRKDGTLIPVLIAAAALEDLPGLGVGFVIDISDLKQSKEETNKITNELSTFLYMASHDLKGPLASVIGLTNISQNDIEDPKALEYINLIQECTYKLDRSLMNFLKIIKIKNNNLEKIEINFNDLIEDIISSLMHQASFSNVEFNIRNSLENNFISDPDLIKSIIQNLVENSVKYQTRMRSPLVTIQIKESEDDISIIVEDNGRGIDEKIINKIFNIFYRGDISSKGSGLGLYIVKSAAEKLQGEVKVQNVISGGSLFTVTLPKLN